MNVVYQLRSSCGKLYIGSTGNIEKRLKQHFDQLRLGKHHNVNMQQLFDNGTEFSVSFNVCEDRAEAYELEEIAINEMMSSGELLNIGLSARGGDNFTHNPNKSELRKKYALAILGLSAEERLRRYSNPGEKNGMFGKTHTPDVKALLSSINIGNTYRLGKKADSKTKERLSEIASQRLGDKNPFFGKTHSDETKRKIAEKKIGIKPINTNQIEIDGIIYSSQSDAAKALGVSIGTITFRLRSNNIKFSGYRVINK